MKNKLKILTGVASTALILTMAGCSGDSLEDKAVSVCKVFENNDYKAKLGLYNSKSRVLKSYNAIIKSKYDGDVDAWAEAKKQKDIKKGKEPKADDFDCTVVKVEGIKGESKQKIIIKKMFGEENHEIKLQRVDGKWYL